MMKKNIFFPPLLTPAVFVNSMQMLHIPNATCSEVIQATEDFGK